MFASCGKRGTRGRLGYDLMHCLMQEVANEGGTAAPADVGTQTHIYDPLGQLSGTTRAGATNQLRLRWGQHADSPDQRRGDHSLHVRHRGRLPERLGATAGSATTWYVRSFGQELSREQAGVGTWLLGDRLGSVRAEVNALGLVSARYDYDPYGVPEGVSQPSDYGFTGEPQEGVLGLVHLRARWYRPSSGRFLTRDPFPGVPTRPQGLHPYAYAENSPATFTDPTGLYAKGQCISSALDHGRLPAWSNTPQSVDPSLTTFGQQCICIPVFPGGPCIEMCIPWPDPPQEPQPTPAPAPAPPVLPTPSQLPKRKEVQAPACPGSSENFYDKTIEGRTVRGRGPEGGPKDCHVNVEVDPPRNWHVYWEDTEYVARQFERGLVLSSDAAQATNELIADLELWFFNQASRHQLWTELWIPLERALVELRKLQTGATPT